MFSSTVDSPPPPPPVPSLALRQGHKYAADGATSARAGVCPLISLARSFSPSHFLFPFFLSSSHACILCLFSFPLHFPPFWPHFSFSLCLFSPQSHSLSYPDLFLPFSPSHLSSPSTFHPLPFDPSPFSVHLHLPFPPLLLPNCNLQPPHLVLSVPPS